MATGVKRKSARPDRTSVIASAPPRNGMCTASNPAAMRKRSALKWVAVPTPAEAKLKAPGLDLAAATRSCAVLKPFDGDTTSTFGLLPSETTAAKSAAVSYDALG